MTKSEAVVKISPKTITKKFKKKKDGKKHFMNELYVYLLSIFTTVYYYLF